MVYKRLTVKDGIDVLKSTEYLLPDDRVYLRLAELEDMIESKKLVFVPEYSEKYAIIKYTFWKNQPFDIAIYYPCGVKMNGDIDYRFTGIKSGYITVVEDGFDTKEAAEEALRKLKEE